MSAIIVIIAVAASIPWQVKDFVFQVTFDLFYENPVVESKEIVDEILTSFERVEINILEKDFRVKSKIDDLPYRNMLQGSKYYLVPQKEVYRRIVGNTRIKDLMSRDHFYMEAIFDRSQKLYWLIDKRILYKILELRKELAAQDYNQDGFWVRHGYRTPQFNEDVNGASESRHIKGEAVDLLIRDINNDGKHTKKDKEIVLSLLENKVIGNSGGIGKYPGTKIVHIDVRGNRARWDTY